MNIRIIFHILGQIAPFNSLPRATLIAVSATLLLASCNTYDPYLYDRPGFDYGTRPVVQGNPNNPVRVAPDYYYRQPAVRPNQYYQQRQQQYQPYNNYGYSGGGSRYYSNPYALPPNGAYPNYDADQYYVPPTYYNNADVQSGSASGGR